MSSSSATFFNPNTALAVQQRAPEDVGFIHTLKNQFTHFLGSGGRTTFGMPCADFANLMNSFSTKLQAGEKSKSAMVNAMLWELDQLDQAITKLANRLAKNDIYQELYTMAQTLVETGHIPLIIEAGAPAAQFERAVRSINVGDLYNYFRNISSAEGQCREYLVKHDMMVLVAAFRKSIVEQRYKLNENDPSFYFCNRLLDKFDTDIIKFNRSSLPHDCEQFDLSNTFINKVHSLICELKVEVAGQKLIDELIAQIHSVPYQNTVSLQKVVSENLYKVLSKHLDAMGFAGDGDVNLDDKALATLQNLAPLMEYLGSRFNPFAQDGIYGAVLSNPFRVQAITAYEEHESKMDDSILPYQYIYTFKAAAANLKYSDDQIDQLIFGSENEEPEEEKGAANTGWLSLFSSEEGSVSPEAAFSQSQALAARLALPMPPQFLMLMPPMPEQDQEEEQKEIVNNNQDEASGPGGPSMKP